MKLFADARSKSDRWVAAPGAKRPFAVMRAGDRNAQAPYRLLQRTPAQISLIVTPMLPRVALEYGQIFSASSTRSFAILRSKPGSLTLSRIQGYLNGRAATGSSSGTSMAIVNQMVQTQATLLAYIDVFVVLGVIAIVMVPLALTLRGVDRSAGSKPAH